MNRLKNINVIAKKKIKLKEEKGLSLLEVMISMIVLSIGILALAPLITISMYGNSYADETTTANALAQRELEILINQSNYGLIPFNSTSDSVNGFYSVARKVEDNVSDALIPVGLYKISIDIGWLDKQNIQRTVQYSSYKSKA